MTTPKADLNTIRKLLCEHIRIDDDSEEWESPRPRIVGIDKAAAALLTALDAQDVTVLSPGVGEQIAKIIDPFAFDEPGHTGGVYQSGPYLAQRQHEAKAKADAILSILPKTAAQDVRRMVDRDAVIEECAEEAINAELPPHFQWGPDAMEQFIFGKQRARDAIRALKSARITAAEAQRKTRYHAYWCNSVSRKSSDCACNCGALQEGVTALAGDPPVTAAVINALPPNLRRYVMDLETRCDPTGDIQTIHSQREQIAGLLGSLAELRAESVAASGRSEGEELMMVKGFDAGFSAGREAREYAQAFANPTTLAFRDKILACDNVTYQRQGGDDDYLSCDLGRECTCVSTPTPASSTAAAPEEEGVKL